MLASRDSPNNCDDIDVLLLDWSFLRIPLESLSISVRQMHKALDADGMRLTAFLTRQFSSPSFNKQQPQHTELADARKPTTEETQEERETNQCSVPVQRCSTSSNGDGSLSSKRLHTNGNQSTGRTSAASVNPVVSRRPVEQSTDTATHTNALQELENRFKETLRAMEKVSEFVQKMKTRVQNHTTEIDKYVTRCDHRINLIISQADSDWPSPRTITSLSSVPSNLTSVPILLTRKAHSEEHASAGPKSTGSLFALMTKRVHVLIHHYLCRHGFMKTAEHLKQSQSLNNLVDTEIYESAAIIIEVRKLRCQEQLPPRLLGAQALQRHDTAPALAWCAAHKSKLRKLQNTLEIQLRLQETVSMILNGNSREAMTYLRNNVAANDAANCINIRPVLSLLAFVNSTAVKTSSWFPSAYTPLFDPERWVELTDLFKESMNSVYEICRRSPLEVLLQSGFSALITKSCSQSLSPSCPSCDPLWNPYVQIPSSHHIRSYIVCPIKGHIMGDEDPPLASPDGLVFSTSAVNALAKNSPDGNIEDPYTDNKYPLERFHRLYIT